MSYDANLTITLNAIYVVDPHSPIVYCRGTAKCTLTDAYAPV